MSESRYPATAEGIARLHMATAATADPAVHAARDAKDGRALTPGRDRGRILRRAADILRARNRELSVPQVLDTGKALQETLLADAASGADRLQDFGGLADRHATRTRAIRPGDPPGETTRPGPPVSHVHREKVLVHVARGVAEGAHLGMGSDTPVVPGCEGGAFVAPTVFADLTDGIRIARKEIFAPVMCVLDFEDENEVVERADATRFGLVAGIFTRDRPRAHRVNARVEVGTTQISTCDLTPVEMAFGGVEQRGPGRENARAARDAMTRVKSVHVETGDVRAPQ